MSVDPGLSPANDLFGFELLYRITESQLSKKEDVLILFVHWYLVRNGFKCLGTGDSKTIGPQEVGAETLPEGWNQAPTFSLRIEDQHVTNAQFPIDTVQNIQGTLENLLPNFQSVLKDLKSDLIQPMYFGTGVETSTQTPQSSDRRPENVDPLRVDPNQRQPLHHPLCEPSRRNPLEIGADDLNPLGRVGIVGPGASSGMIFDPFTENRRRQPQPSLGIPGRLPPGAVPPGARFDPFGPPDMGQSRYFPRRPDGDHFPPPGYDDMFM